MSLESNGLITIGQMKIGKFTWGHIADDPPCRATVRLVDV